MLKGLLWNFSLMKVYEYRTDGFYQQAYTRINIPDPWEGYNPAGVTQALLLMDVPGRHDRIKLKIYIY